eukprot:sb/3472982/
MGLGMHHCTPVEQIEQGGIVRPTERGFKTVNHYSSVLEDTGGGGGGGGRYSSIGNTTAPLLSSTTNNNNNTASEVRQLRFENLILQSKVETLEAENKKLREVVLIFYCIFTFIVEIGDKGCFMKMIVETVEMELVENRTNDEIERRRNREMRETERKR